MLIEAKNLTKKFGAKVAVDNINISIKPGLVTAILGPNGAGKSTAIKMLTGQTKPTGGQILIDNQSYDQIPSHFRGKIGIMPQETILWDDLNILENLRFSATMQGMKADKIKQQMDFLIEGLNLQKELKTLAKNLSGGFKRRLNLAISIIHDPEVIFLDEPSPGIDPQNRRFLWDFINSLRASGKYSIVLTDHYLEEAEKVSDFVYIIDNGKIIAEGSLDEVKNKHGDELSLRMQLPQDVDTLALAKAVESLKKHFVRTQAFDNTISVSADDQVEAIEKSLSILAQYSLKPVNLVLKQSTLEDVFLNLTGREVRD